MEDVPAEQKQEQNISGLVSLLKARDRPLRNRFLRITDQRITFSSIAPMLLSEFRLVSHATAYFLIADCFFCLLPTPVALPPRQAPNTNPAILSPRFSPLTAAKPGQGSHRLLRNIIGYQRGNGVHEKLLRLRWAKSVYRLISSSPSGD